MSSVPGNPQRTFYQALYRSCVKDAAAQGRALMQQLVLRARKSMPQRAVLAADAAGRNFLTEAARILMKHEAALCEAYPQALLAEFAHAIAGDTRRAGGLSFDSLELMGDDQVREGLELLRTQQAVQLVVRTELAELDGLMRTVQGLRSTQAGSTRVDHNPLRPEIYLHSLRTAILQSPVPATVRAAWMLHLGEAMGPELARVYRELSAMLRRNGVSEAGVNGAMHPAEAVPGAAALVPAALAARHGEATALLNIEQLRRLLAGDFEPGQRDKPVAQADFSETMPAALETLQEMRQVDQVIQRMRQRRAVGLVDDASGAAALRAALQKEARGPGQALALEVVALMLDNITGDARLLPPVQQAVRDLEPALLRLALADPRFFSDKKHAARQLLEQMTERSLAWPAVDAPGFADFLAPLRHAVDVLADSRTAGVEPFEAVLRLLKTAWGDQQQRDGALRENAVRALLQAEQRNLLAGRIAKEMRHRADIAGGPSEIARFVMGPWSQVMAQARLADQSGAADPGGYADLVTDLTASVQARLGSGNATRLARLVPPLLDKLRSGLAAIGYPPTQTGHFFDYLEMLHRQALHPRAPAAVMTREQLEARFAQEVGDIDPAEGEASSWLAPAEARHSGFMEALPSTGPQPVAAAQPAGGDGRRPPEQDAGFEALLPTTRLLPGAWVELLLDGRWIRLQLTWASPHGTLFMFVNGAGKTQSMTRQLLDTLLRAGSLRMVSGQAVVDGALDAVARTALRNSLGPGTWPTELTGRKDSPRDEKSNP